MGLIFAHSLLLSFVCGLSIGMAVGVILAVMLPEKRV